MRKTGLLAGFIALTLIVGCESDGCKFTYSKYYIENYVDGDLVLLPYYAVRSSASDLPAPVSEGFGVSIYEGVYYQSPELKGAQHPDEFLRIAERNGDTEFNDLKSPPEQGIIAFADNFTGIKVTSDKDWSAEYPAGTSLNDKMGVRYVSYAEYKRAVIRPGSILGKIFYTTNRCRPCNPTICGWSNTLLPPCRFTRLYFILRRFPTIRARCTLLRWNSPLRTVWSRLPR